jgi:hypothetical protein
LKKKKALASESTRPKMAFRNANTLVSHNIPRQTNLAEESENKIPLSLPSYIYPDRPPRYDIARAFVVPAEDPLARAAKSQLIPIAKRHTCSKQSARHYLLRVRTSAHVVSNKVVCFFVADDGRLLCMNKQTEGGRF